MTSIADFKSFTPQYFLFVECNFMGVRIIIKEEANWLRFSNITMKLKKILWFRDN